MTACCTCWWGACMALSWRLICQSASSKWCLRWRFTVFYPGSTNITNLLDSFDICIPIPKDGILSLTSAFIVEFSCSNIGICQALRGTLCCPSLGCSCSETKHTKLIWAWTWTFWYSFYSWYEQKFLKFAQAPTDFLLQQCLCLESVPFRSLTLGPS